VSEPRQVAREPFDGEPCHLLERTRLVEEVRDSLVDENDGPPADLDLTALASVEALGSPERSASAAAARATVFRRSRGSR
jgi:hypothetical protein